MRAPQRRRLNLPVVVFGIPHEAAAETPPLVAAERLVPNRLAARTFRALDDCH